MKNKTKQQYLMVNPIANHQPLWLQWSYIRYFAFKASSSPLSKLHNAKVRFYFPLNNNHLYKKFNDISLFIEFSNLLTLLIHFSCNFGLDQHGLWPSLVDQMVKNLPTMWETWVRYLGWEDPVEVNMTLSSIFAWRIHMDREAWWATVHGAAKSWTWLSN